jgi:hypothetical protein
MNRPNPRQSAAPKVLTARDTGSWLRPGTTAPVQAFDVIDAVAYLDTIELWVFRRLPDGLLSSLRKEYGSRFIFEPLWVTPAGQVRRSKITIHQPTAATLAALDSLKPRPFTVHRVDIAVDFLVATTDEARLLQDFLDRYVIQKWRRPDHRRHVELTTSYWKDDAGSPRNIALYSDRPSKVSLGPCGHFEMRFKSTRTCNAAGFSSLPAFVAGIDVRALLKRQAKITLIDPNLLDRLFEKTAREQVRRSQDGRTVREIKAYLLEELVRDLLGAAETVHDNTIARFPSQELWDTHPELRSCFREIAWDEFGPAPRWSWPVPR